MCIRVREQADLGFKGIVFVLIFDDEYNNIRDYDLRGMVLVKRGSQMFMNSLEKGLGMVLIRKASGGR